MTPIYKVIRESYTCLSTRKKVIISVIYLFINFIIIIIIISIIIIIIIIISDDPKTREARDAHSRLDSTSSPGSSRFPIWRRQDIPWCLALRWSFTSSRTTDCGDGWLTLSQLLLGNTTIKNGQDRLVTAISTTFVKTFHKLTLFCERWRRRGCRAVFKTGKLCRGRFPSVWKVRRENFRPFHRF